MVTTNPNPSNISQAVNCSIFWNDSFPISSVIIGENSLGSYENHTIAFSGNSGIASYIISGNKLSNAGTYSCIFYATDAAGNLNFTSKSFTVNDVTAPIITVTSPGNFTYNQQIIQISFVANKNISSAWYSLNGTANVSMDNTSQTNWNSTLSLANSAYKIQFYANDSFGNFGNSSLIYFSVNTFSDVIPPVITIINPVNASYHDISLILNISSNEALSSVFYKLNGGSLTSLANSSTTNWYSSISGLTQESTNTLVIYSNDTSNNQANSTITFYVDTLAPRYSLVTTNPNPANISQAVNCSIFWNDSFPISSVIIGENSLGSYENHTIAFSGNSGSASYIISGNKLSSAGTYSCIFYATDAAGNLNFTSKSFTVNDVTQPIITVTSPTNSSTYNQLFVPISLVSNKALTLAGFSLNGAVNVSMTNTSTTNWNYNLTGLSNGQTYSLVFYGQDNSGNIGASNVFVFSIDTGLADTIPPVLSSSLTNSSYKTSTSFSFNVSSNKNLNWSGYKLNGGVLTDLTNLSASLWTGTLVGLASESTNNLVIYGNDSSNNKGNLTITFYVDNLAPTFSSPTANPNPANETQNVVCNVYINESFSLSSVKIAENATSFGTFINHTIDLTSSGYANYTILNVPRGNYQCIFYATDIAGNTNSTSTNFVVNDVTAPVITVTSPSNSTYGDSSILASLITNENASSAWYSLDGSSNLSLSGSSTSWSTTLVLTSIGSHNIRFYANDSSGNVGNSSLIYFSVLVTDIIPPVLSSSLANASYKNSLPILFNVSSNENLTLAKYSLNGGALVSLTNLSSILWNGTLTGLISGSTNSLVIYGNDSSNNQGNMTVIFYFDNQSPQFISPTANPNPANETQNVVCNVYINESFSLSSVKISENATSFGTFINHTIDLTSSGYANYTILNVPRGNYQCIFYATDIAGNTNSTSTNFVVNDVTAPVITVNSPMNQSYSTDSILFSIATNELTSFAKYSLNGGATNVSLTLNGVSWSNVSSLVDGGYTVIFYANDSSGNEGKVNVSFVVDTSVNDITPPTITIFSPINGSYLLSSNVLLNISADENLAWAAYKNSSGSLINLNNISGKNWEKTITLNEGLQTINFYANDTSSNKNQGNRNVSFYVDLNNPSVNSFSCNSTINDSSNLSCSALFFDAVGLDYAILSYNFSGSFVNSSKINLNGNLSRFNYTFTEGNYTPGNYGVKVYLFDLSGRVNDSEVSLVSVLDDRAPAINNFSYSPTSELLLDPGVSVYVNASVSDNYKMGEVYLMYKNNTDSVYTSVFMDNSSLTNYNASFVSPAGIVSIKINATDAQGNSNISDAKNLNVFFDTTDNVSTNIDSIKSITYAQRNSSNLLGKISLNNTGDNDLNFSVTISSASNILDRFNLNYSLNQSETYSVLAGNNLTIDALVNTTDLISGLYPFVITVSSDAGTEIFSKNLNIQTSSGPYLVVSIDEYSSYVTRGQTGINSVVSVTNLGTSDATGVNLYWTLPTGINLTSGSLNRYIGNLPIGAVAQNSLVFSVSSDISLSNLTLIATANESSIAPSSDTKFVTVLNPIVVNTQTTVSGGGGGAGRQGAGMEVVRVNYSNTIEVLRGDTNTFEIKVVNRYANTTLKNLVLNISGFLEQYISVNPYIISEINYSDSAVFVVTVKSPNYKSYEEDDLKVLITGDIVSSTGSNKYYETQYIKLILQDMSYADSEKQVNLAIKAVDDMNKNQFYTKDVEALLVVVKDKLANHQNKDAYDLALSIVRIRDKAFSVYSLINKIYAELGNPSQTNFLTGNVVFDEKNGSSFVYNFLGKKYLFASDSVQQLLGMAVVAFNRGDFNLAEERANSAQILLVLERKGNVGLFFYLYWQIILIGALVLIALLIISYKLFRKNRISSEIYNLDNKELEINKLLVKSQSLRFNGKLSVADYSRAVEGYHHELAKIKDRRVALRNSRVKLLKFDDVIHDLDKERRDVENRIKFIQKEFYVDKKISEYEYNEEFSHANSLLAEIEDERVTLNLMNKNKKNSEVIKK